MTLISVSRRIHQRLNFSPVDKFNFISENKQFISPLLNISLQIISYQNIPNAYHESWKCILGSLEVESFIRDSKSKAHGLHKNKTSSVQWLSWKQQLKIL